MGEPISYAFTAASFDRMKSPNTPGVTAHSTSLPPPLEINTSLATLAIVLVISRSVETTPPLGP